MKSCNKKNDTHIRYVNQKEKLSPHLICSICQDVFSDPVFITCGHVFCKNCILKWGKNRSQCPQCRQLFNQKGVIPCYLARSLIGDLQIYCVNPGCRWEGKLTQLQNHLRQCKYDPKSLPQWLVESFKNWDGKGGQDTSSNQFGCISQGLGGGGDYKVDNHHQSYTSNYFINKLKEQIQNGQKPDQKIFDMSRDINQFAQIKQQKQSNDKKNDQIFMKKIFQGSIDHEIEESKQLLRRMKKCSPSPFSSPQADQYKINNKKKKNLISFSNNDNENTNLLNNYSSNIENTLKEKDQDYENYLQSLSQNAQVKAKPEKKKKYGKKNINVLPREELNSKFKCELSSPCDFRKYQ